MAELTNTEVKEVVDLANKIKTWRDDDTLEQAPISEAFDLLNEIEPFLRKLVE